MGQLYFSMHIDNPMKKTVGCFTESKLRELASQPNVTVMQPTHDITYQPWSAERVDKCVDRIVAAVCDGVAADALKRDDADVCEFASKYTVFFSKLSDRAFASDVAHVAVVKQLVALRALVEQGGVDETEAKARAADIALKSLMSRTSS